MRSRTKKRKEWGEEVVSEMQVKMLVENFTRS